MSQSSAYGIPIDTDGTLSNNSDQLVPSQKAVKTYVDTEIAAIPTPPTPNLEDVLTEGNDGGGLEIENIADPTTAQSAVTRQYYEDNMAADTRAYFCQTDSISYADGATYYFGSNPITPVTALYDRVAIWFRHAGTITSAELLFSSFSVAGSNENISIYIRLNDTTDYLIATVGNTNRQKVFSNTAMSVPIANGDFINLKLVCPTWATNPTVTNISGEIILTLS